MLKRKDQKFYVFLASLVIGVFSFLFTLAKTVEKKTMYFNPGEDSAINYSSVTPSLLTVYDSIHPYLHGVSRTVFEMAASGFNKLVNHGRLTNDSIISIIDFSLPSSEKRLFIVDIKNFRVLVNTFVAHGRNSGKALAKYFSNSPRSFKSSPGFYITGSTYYGKHGYSLKLHGVEKRINDNAERRALVIHGADYVSESLIHSQGYIGRSLGCPAVSEKDKFTVINTIKEGSCLFIYSTDQHYFSNSSFIK
jgi:hypothetical protein